MKNENRKRKSLFDNIIIRLIIRILALIFIISTSITFFSNKEFTTQDLLLKFVLILICVIYLYSDFKYKKQSNKTTNNNSK